MPSPRGLPHAPNSSLAISSRDQNPLISFFSKKSRLTFRTSLLDDARVCAAFLGTDAEDQTLFEDVPFSTMTLLSRQRFVPGPDLQKEGDGIEGGERFMLGCVSRVTLPSKYRRDALYVDIISPTAPGTVFRLINLHLDSLEDTLHYRAQQMKILANVLREPGCSGGIIAGDFNAISPEDDGLIDKNELVDAWVALHERADPDGAKEMGILGPALIEVPRPGEKPFEIPWSDHCGLRCTFTI